MPPINLGGGVYMQINLSGFNLINIKKIKKEDEFLEKDNNIYKINFNKFYFNKNKINLN